MISQKTALTMVRCTVRSDQYCKFQTPATGNFQKPALFAASFLCQQFLLSRFSSCNFCSAFLWFHQGATTVSNKEAGAKLILKSTLRDRTPCTWQLPKRYGYVFHLFFHSLPSLIQFGISLMSKFSSLASFFCSSKAIRLSVIFCWSWPMDWRFLADSMSRCGEFGNVGKLQTWPPIPPVQPALQSWSWSRNRKSIVAFSCHLRILTCYHCYLQSYTCITFATLATWTVYSSPLWFETTKAEDRTLHLPFSWVRS